MFQTTVTNKDGVQKRVFATEEADLKEAEKAVKDQSSPVYPNINVPRRKGEDLVSVGDDMSVTLVDGRGAHNSPYDAIDRHGNENGEEDVQMAGLKEMPYKKAGSAEPVDADGKTADEQSDKSSKRKDDSSNAKSDKQEDNQAVRAEQQEDGTNHASNVTSESSTSLDQGNKNA